MIVYFIRQIHLSDHAWVVFTSYLKQQRLMVNAILTNQEFTEYQIKINFLLLNLKETDPSFVLLSYSGYFEVLVHKD